jgi:hypothetical protein
MGRLARASLMAVALLSSVACVGATGGSTIDFPVAAAGPADATGGRPLAFTAEGWDVVLTRATLHIGGVYLDQSAPVSGGQATGCYLTGTYLAQETAGLDVDLLSPEPQPFSAKAHGITSPPTRIGQVWLTGGDINAVASATDILVIAGGAARDGMTFPFSGTITIGANHGNSGGALAGGDPICKERIVTPIPAALTIQETGGLLLRIDPRLYFVNLDFGQLPTDASTGAYVFSDDPTAPGYAPTGYDLYYNLRATAAYDFSWTDAL